MNRSEPSRLSAAVFSAKAMILRGDRRISNLQNRLRRFAQGDQAQYTALLAESRTPLWTTTSLVENSLQFGKVQNLRRACGRLHLAEVPVGEIFSFWKQIGRARKAHGYTRGRELRQGCLIPTIGGGLCQLSNALYDLALKSGCDIVERHGHTAIVSGSAAALGRDATVFWNYVDLRFAPAQDLLISARLSAEELILQFWGKHSQVRIQSQSPLHRLQSVPKVNSCDECGREACFRHTPNSRAKYGGHSAFLIEECWAEFDQFCRQVKSENDELLIPWHSAWSSQPHRYRWSIQGYSKVIAANSATFFSSLQTRFGFAHNLPPIALQLRRSQSLAACYSQRLSASASFLYVSQTLLPFLWQAGDLGGRRFTVLVTRMPLRLLHSRLDDLSRQFPDQKSFQEFRAPQWMVEAEAEALEQAEQIVTAHAWLAGLFPQKTQRLSWSLPPVAKGASGGHLVFPGPTVARKGAYPLRDAMKGRNDNLLLLGSNLESANFWDGVNTCQANHSEDWLRRARVVVQPAFIENSPRHLLRALAAGLPVIATAECGLDPHPNLMLVKPGDTAELRHALAQMPQ